MVRRRTWWGKPIKTNTERFGPRRFLFKVELRGKSDESGKPGVKIAEREIEGVSYRGAQRTASQWARKIGSDPLWAAGFGGDFWLPIRDGGRRDVEADVKGYVRATLSGFLIVVAMPTSVHPDDLSVLETLEKELLSDVAEVFKRYHDYLESLHHNISLLLCYVLECAGGEWSNRLEGLVRVLYEYPKMPSLISDATSRTIPELLDWLSEWMPYKCLDCGREDTGRVRYKRGHGLLFKVGDDVDCLECGGHAVIVKKVDNQASLQMLVKNSLEED